MLTRLYKALFLSLSLSLPYALSHVASHRRSSSSIGGSGSGSDVSVGNASFPAQTVATARSFQADAKIKVFVDFRLVELLLLLLSSFRVITYISIYIVNVVVGFFFVCCVCKKREKSEAKCNQETTIEERLSKRDEEVTRTTRVRRVGIQIET